MPPTPTRGRLACWRCGRVLENATGRSLDAALACTIATLLLLLPANLMPVMTMHIAGISRSTYLVSGLGTAWGQGWPMVTIVLGLQALVLPTLRFGLLSVTLGALRLGRRGGWIGRAFRYCEVLDVWTMADVLLVGAGIGYGRIASQIPVRIDVSGWCFVGAAVMTMVTRASLERRAVWRRLEMPPQEVGADAVACRSCDLVLPGETEGQRCPRCFARVHRRRPYAVMQRTALLSATFALTPFAYDLPMGEYWLAGMQSPCSIIDGIEMLFQSKFWYFGIVISFVSVVFPLAKLISLTWFLLSVRRRSPCCLRRKTQLYRFIDNVGRWSTVDPFAVIIFAPLVQFGELAHIDVMQGSPIFLATVVLSMIAARAFDPRLMWDVPGAEPCLVVAPVTAVGA
ncbi:paraquat-inducible protein A [Rhodopila sp.]|uniref:paraquat-inducible protein A n=1 Tax=Rhodopila sp. TaxID=2480087 RepID=UPI003D1319C0